MDTNGKPRRAALYARVSSDEQAEKGTIESQTQQLHYMAEVFGVTITAEYLDDGQSGMLPFHERPAGRRLLEDAEARLFDEVLVLRVDRLSRALVVLMRAHERLEAAGISIRSATEPFDTSTHVGKFFFHLLGSLAELDRASKLEQMVVGRDRVARGGKWTDGPIPLGYDLDDKSMLIPSEREIEGLGITERQLVVDLFERIAGGSTTVAEARRLQALGVTHDVRYGTGKVTSKLGAIWHPTQIGRIIKGPLYKGTHLLRSKRGIVERPAPALVDPDLWARANAQLGQNQALSRRNVKRWYLLRGLIRCGDCGHTFAGRAKKRDIGETLYYHCNGECATVSPEPSGRCRAKSIPAAWIESRVWQDVCNFIQHPEEALAEAQRQVRDKMQQSSAVEAERMRLAGRLKEHDEERERVLLLYRRGHTRLQEVEGQLGAIAIEAAETQSMLNGLIAQLELLRTMETRMVDASAMLGRLRERLAEIEASHDQQPKREIVELLVQSITVHTVTNGKRKDARIVARYVFGPSVPIVIHNAASPANNSTLSLECELVLT